MSETVDGPPPGWCPECDGPSRCAPGTCCGVGAPEAARELHEALDDLQGLAHRLGFCCYAAALDPNGPCPWHAEAVASPMEPAKWHPFGGVFTRDRKTGAITMALTLPTKASSKKRRKR